MELNKHEIVVDREVFHYLIIHADEPAKVIAVCKEVLNEE